MSLGLYPQIFLENAWAASIVPLASQTTFYAMKAFGGYDMRIPFALAVAGATCGQMFNWGIGRLLLHMRHNQTFKVSDAWYERIRFQFIRYGVFLLFFSWAPLCNFFVVAAGFLGARPKLVLPLVIAGQLYNYGRVFF